MNHPSICLIAGAGRLPRIAFETLAAHPDYARHTIHLLVLTPPTPFITTLAASVGARGGTVFTPTAYSLHETRAFLEHAHVGLIAFAGKVDKQALLAKVRFDWEFISLAARLITKSDSALMEFFIEELKKLSISIIPQRELCLPQFVAPGVLTGPLTAEIEKDARYGLALATELSRLDVGQTVVVENQIALALEGLEGTDACIGRGRLLGNGHVVVCKTARETQSNLYDIPVIGPETITALPLTDSGVAAIIWHASRTMLIDPAACSAEATARGITLVAYAS